MAELRVLDNGDLRQSFAGDVYNSAVYLKRCFKQFDTALFTAVGNDKLSQRMIARLDEENLNTEFVFKHPDKTLGLYMIETDESGERSFSYWRNDSAARKLVNFLDDTLVNALNPEDVMFFSGISLAVIDEDTRERFWEIIDTLKDRGLKIIFDSNYRPRLWSCVQEAKYQYEQALAHADMILPSVEDLQPLFGVGNPEELVAFCRLYDIEEIVVKDGPNSVLSSYQGQQQYHQIIPVEKVIDTTSAGDAFNGVYVGARLSGKSVDEAVKQAACAAGVVIQFAGAIVPYDHFMKAIKA